MKTLYVLLLVAFLLPSHSWAKTFANQFIEFQLPEKWECQLDGTEWVCQSTDEQKKRDAIIVLAAKIKKQGMDDLAVYKAHLEKPAVYDSLNNEKISSEPRYVKEIDIAGKPWIDSLHLASEIPDFYTRYLATIQDDLGILVTFSVRKDKYEEYAPDIENMVKSMRAFRKPGGVNDNAGNTPEIDPNATIFDANKGDKGGKKKTSGGSEDAGMLLLLVLVVGGGAGFIIWKKKQKK